MNKYRLSESGPLTIRIDRNNIRKQDRPTRPLYRRRMELVHDENGNLLARLYYDKNGWLRAIVALDGGRYSVFTETGREHGLRMAKRLALFELAIAEGK